MTNTHDLQEIVDVVPHNHLQLKVAASLQVAAMPAPYVPPKFHFVDERGEHNLNRDVVLVRAPAAVGKSTTARFISHTRNLPLLDLSYVTVAQDSFSGILQQSFQNSLAAIDAVHSGDLTVIVDALDEARMLSSDKSFEAFLTSTRQFLSERPSAGRPKIILFGRQDSILISQIGFDSDSDSSGPTICEIELDYFDSEAAHRLIRLSAIEVILGPNDTISHEVLDSSPMADLISTYFSSIESALGLDEGALWTHNVGRSFAGYAPVLGALGRIISYTFNPIVTKNQLSDTTNNDAWDVVCTVLEEIINREKDKFQKLFRKSLSPTIVPDNAYDFEEQLTYLLQLIHNLEINSTGRVAFSHNENSMTYINQVRTTIDDHPFVQERKAANDVLGSAILSHAVILDLLNTHHVPPDAVIRLSRQPFLWRHVQRSIKMASDGDTDSLLDGGYVGYLLNSYWSDPVGAQGGADSKTAHKRVKIVDDGIDSRVMVQGCGRRGTQLRHHTTRDDIYDCPRLRHRCTGRNYNYRRRNDRTRSRIFDIPV